MPNNDITTDHEAVTGSAKDIGTELVSLRAQEATLTALKAKAEAEAGTVADPFKPTVSALGSALDTTLKALKEHIAATESASSGAVSASTEQQQNAEDAKVTFKAVDTSGLVEI